MELLCCNSLLFVSLLIPILMCCVTEQQINKEELGTTTERGKMGCTEEAQHIQRVSGKPGIQEEVWGQSVLPIHQNYKIFYFCLFLLLKKKKKSSQCDSTGNKWHFGINSSILQPPASKQTARHWGTSFASARHWVLVTFSFSLFCNFSKLEQSRKKAPVSTNIWHSPWSWHLNLTCSGGTPSSARADSKNLFAGFPTTSAWISQAYCGKKRERNTKKADQKRICSTP